MISPDGPLLPRRCAWKCLSCLTRGYDDPHHVGTPQWNYWAHWRAAHAPSSIFAGVAGR